jgi:hypothetical protein
MNLEDVLKQGGRGIIATASKLGVVNTAVYAVPHIGDGETVTWGMTDGQTWENVRENPSASYAYFAHGEGYRGTRLSLVLTRTEDEGKMLEEIRERARKMSPVDVNAIRHVAVFKVVEIRPLV